MFEWQWIQRVAATLISSLHIGQARVLTLGSAIGLSFSASGYELSDALHKNQGRDIGFIGMAL
ncbi:hypothetical protein [Rhizobium sp. Rhizsp82]|uniref:hypothetical protein n=1 Tax=Rhizobium sp. Rhizsp82 TaxID=3243057 RepID=UPI0039B53C08